MRVIAAKARLVVELRASRVDSSVREAGIAAIGIIEMIASTGISAYENRHNNSCDSCHYVSSISWVLHVYMPQQSAVGNHDFYSVH